MPTTTKDKIAELGDPSGKHTSSYWDEWFQTVCYSETHYHRSFEWYCDVIEVIRILKFHNIHPPSSKLTQQETCREEADEAVIRIIHPGSGNSLVPVQLRNEYGSYCHHTVVDISSVAMDEMKNMHDSTANDNNNTKKNYAIDYLIHDILDTPLPYANEYFDIWLDKGLLDALFSGGEESKHQEDENEKKCTNLFEEAHRLLTIPSAGNEATGKMIIISMAENHSLSLILDQWRRTRNKKSDICRKRGSEWMWDPTIHIHEIHPISGNMLPFAFVLSKMAPNRHYFQQQQREKHQHFDNTDTTCNAVSQSPSSIIVFHKLNGETKQIVIDIPHDNGIDGNKEPTSPLSSLFEPIYSVLSEARTLFSIAATRQNRKAAEKEHFQRDNDVGGGDKGSRLLLATIEIKPSHPNVNLNDLCKRITSSPKMGIVANEENEPKQLFDISRSSFCWYHQNKYSADCKDGFFVNNGLGRIVPIGFGISKLVLQCIIDSNCLETLCNTILAREGEQMDSNVERVESVENGDERQYVGCVQSVDIDWDNTIPVKKTGDLLINMKEVALPPSAD